MAAMYTKITVGLLLMFAIAVGLLFFFSDVELTNNQLVIAPKTNQIGVVPLAIQVGQLFAIGHWPSIPTDLTTQRVNDLQLGSVIVMAAPTDETEVTQWTDTWQASSTTPLLISIDQEGGIVSRLKGPEHPQTAQPQITTVERADEVAQQRGHALRRLGINVNYAPVLDQSVLADSFMYPRVFRDPTMIATLGDAMIRGYQDNGVIAAPKHFPGHPDSSDDSHITLPILDLTYEQYIDHTQQFTDTITTGNVQMLMTAHVLVPALDPTHPATVSPAVLTDLRERVGYDGVIITDDLAMQAISDHWGYAEAAIMSLRAGADMVMLAAEPQYASSTIAAVIEAVENGELSRERVFEAYSRVMTVKESL